MTALTTTASAPRTRLHLTVRGRRVLAGAIALPVAAIIGWGVLGMGQAVATSEGGAPAGTFETVTVTPGDSLWSIAEQVAPNADPRDVVDAIRHLNALDTTALSSGDRISIPVEYKVDAADATLDPALGK